MTKNDSSLADAIDMVTLEDTFYMINNRQNEEIVRESMRIFYLTCYLVAKRNEENIT